MFFKLLPTLLLIFSPLLLSLAQFGIKGIIYYIAYLVIVMMSFGIIKYMPMPIQEIFFYTSVVPLMFLTGDSCCKKSL